jgi:hypothetical protein
MSGMFPDLLQSLMECETKYKVLEQLEPVPEMTPAQLEELNSALKVSPKARSCHGCIALKRDLSAGVAITKSDSTSNVLNVLHE